MASHALTDVVNAYVKQLKYFDANFDETPLRNLVKNLKQVETSDTAIYDELAALHPEAGCPLVFYEEFFLPNDISSQKAQKAAAKLKKRAAQTTKDASAEFANKKRCSEFEIATLKRGVSLSNLTTAPKPKRQAISTPKIAISVGSYVQVEPDLSPGKKSFGGTGYVVAVRNGNNPLFKVKYDLGGTEKDIPLERLTVVPNPIYNYSNKRKREATDVMNVAKSPPKKQTAPLCNIEDIIQHGYSSKKGGGWRARELGFVDKRQKGFKEAFRRDAVELNACIHPRAREASQSSFGNECP